MFNATDSATTVTAPTLAVVVSPLTDIERLVLAVILGLISVAGILGNGLVIAAVWLSHKLRTVTNVYVVNLGLADFVTCSMTPVYIIALTSTDSWPGSELPCTIAGVLAMICVGCSEYTMAGIALNRYVLVTKPREVYTTLCRRRNIIASIFGTWFVPILVVTLPPLFGIGEVGFDPKHCRCGQKYTGSNSYEYILFTALTPVALCTVVYCYVKVFLFVKRHCQNMMTAATDTYGSSAAVNQTNDLTVTAETRTDCDTSDNYRTKELRKRVNHTQHQITKNLFYVVCAFIICLAPYSVLASIPDGYRYMPYAGVLYLLNCAMNPAIYAVKHPYFKSAFKTIVKMELSKIP